MRVSALLFTLAVPLLAQKDGAQRHLFSASEALSAPSRLPAAEVARDNMRATAPQLGLGPEDIAGVYTVNEYRTGHNGVTHFVYGQQFQGLEVYNAAWVVNVDREGRVINAGGSLYSRPAVGVAIPQAPASLGAVRAAVQAVNPQLAERYVPFGLPAPDSKSVRFHRGAFGEDVQGRMVWYAVRGILRPAWVFYVVDGDGISAFETVVDSASTKVLAKETRTFFQSPRGLVFERGSPQPNPTPGIRITAPPPVVPRTMQPFTGDPVASPRGWITGSETAGNNTVTGVNPRGITCIAGSNCPLTPQTTRGMNGDFSFPLEMGPGSPNPTNFADAAAVNLFYWVNRSHDWFYQLGFDEAAGNFQTDNFGRGGSGGDPVHAYAQYGAAAQNATRLNNAFFGGFGAQNDGSPGILAVYLYATTPGPVATHFAEQSFDAETIVHEYAHGVSHRLVRRLNASFHGGAMGEGWSDFWALELLLPEGAPPDGYYPFSEFPGQDWGLGIRTRAYSTNMEVNPLTFANFGRVYYFPEVHADGEIWAQVLWEARTNLIRQFGEKEGRRRIRLLVIDGMKLSPPAPSMLDMRDAILMADRVNFNGASQTQLWAAFAKRAMGVLAQAGDGNAIHVTPSFATPSNTGSLAFYEDRYVIGEIVRVVLHDGNATAPSVTVQLTGSSGDRETLTMRRTGSVYIGAIATGYGAAFRRDNLLQLIPGDSISVYYTDPDTGGGPRLIQATVDTMPDYSLRQTATGMRITARETALNLRAGPFTDTLRALPFEFPFFGKKYSSVWVSNSGVLAFDLPEMGPCTDAYSLSLNKVIAAMYMDLRTDGRAQPGEDVYVSQASPDSVTFRWAAETSPDFIGSNPEPVNFAITLYQDGRIQMNYGAGNANLTAGSQFYTCATATPTVGISNGNTTFYQLSPLHDGKPKLENAPGLLFEPGFMPQGGPQAKLESPSPGASVKGVLTASGAVWDVDGEMLIRRVDVLVDGVNMGRAAIGVSRPDFCAGQAVNGCPRVGFTFTVSPAVLGIAPGEHQLQFRATNTRGAIYTFPEEPAPFTLEAGEAPPPMGRIESPADGAEISGSVTIRGYAFTPTLRVAQVDILVDGITYGQANYGEARPEACADLDPLPPNCPRPGFSYSLNTLRADVPLPNGTHLITARVLDESGRNTVLAGGITVKVNNTPPGRPVGALTSLRHNQTLTGIVDISGYAYSPGGRITSVSLYVDGYNYGPLQYGSGRPDECAALQEVSGCPGIGFEGSFDTRRLSNGVHSLGILVRDDKGQATLFPGVIQLGISVLVAN